jgi:hypothetical protein
MLRIKYCPTNAGIFIRIDQQRPINRDPDGSEILWEDTNGVIITSAGGPDWDGDTLFLKGCNLEIDDRIIFAPDRETDIVRAIWRHSSACSNNKLDLDDVFELDVTLVKQYDEHNGTDHCVEDDVLPGRWLRKQIND